MTPRRRRMLAVGFIVVGVGIATALALQAFNQSLLYFYSPSQVLSGEAPAGERMFRLGGLVRDGSFERESGSMAVRFVLTDMAQSVPVEYEGLLPDLFREGQGIIAHGVLGNDGVFRAEEVLAKHDENYMSPEFAAALEKAGHPVKRDGSGDGT